MLLGKDRGGSAVHLDVPLDLARHVTILGTTGSGKTVTTERIIEAACAAQMAVVVVDVKGGKLRHAVSALGSGGANAGGVLSPLDGGQLGYNPCELGGPAQVADKLVSAFSFDAAGEIYRQISQEAIALTVDALRSLNKPVNVRTLRDLLDPRSLTMLGREVQEKNPQLAGELQSLASRGALTAMGLAGMRARLGSLLHGIFGGWLDAPKGWDVAGALATPGISYICLPVMASSGDVALMSRVLVQDIKQVACSRMEGYATPALVVFDEFAALGDPVQMSDLLRQAREAAVGIVVATQHLPQDIALRQSLLSAGLVIAHHLDVDDASVVSALCGAIADYTPTRVIDAATRTWAPTSVSRSERAIVTPTDLISQKQGEVVVVRSLGQPRVTRCSVVASEGLGL